MVINILEKSKNFVEHGGALAHPDSLPAGISYPGKVGHLFGAHEHGGSMNILACIRMFGTALIRHAQQCMALPC